jgi:hypothetical protein
MMVTNTLILLYANDDVPYMQNKEVKKFTFDVVTSPNDVITSKFLLIWKALIKTFHLRYYTI